MPLKVRRFCTSFLAISFGFAIAANAQTQATQTPGVNQPAIARAPTSAEVMRDRLSKAKAYIAVRNYSAAVFELENIRRESGDPSVNAVANVLLMNSYIEQGDYKRAQDFLNEFYKSYKSNSAAGNLFYSAVAAQVVKGARNQVDRYRALGLSVSDRNLPLEAVNDIERMRELIEVVITQAKDLGGDKNKSEAAMALLDEATNSRSLLARDDYDARRWRDEAADSREQIANSRSVVINAVDGTAVQTGAPQQQTVAAIVPPPSSGTPGNPIYVPEQKPVTTPANSAPVFKPVAAEIKPAETTNAGIQHPVTEVPKKADNSPAGPKRDAATAPQTTPNNTQAAAKPSEIVVASAPATKETGPLDVGSLLAYAVKQQAPIYPIAARNMRTAGVVRVEVTVDENGEVADVEKTSGPTLLQTAAKDAIRKWKFKPFIRDGQPVKATGFVNFNFSL